MDIIREVYNKYLFSELFYTKLIGNYGDIKPEDDSSGNVLWILPTGHKISYYYHAIFNIFLDNSGCPSSSLSICEKDDLYSLADNPCSTRFPEWLVQYGLKELNKQTFLRD